MAKKLVFALPFLLSFYWFCFQLTPFFSDPYLIFSFNTDVLVKLILLVVSLLLSCLFYVLFSTLADDWRIILSLAIVGAFAGMLFFTPPSGYFLSGGFLAAFVLSYYLLSVKLKTYTNFQASSLLNPSIKTTATLIILVTSVVFYFSADIKIKAEGFRIPDSLIDAALKIAAPQVKGIKISQAPSLTQEQLEFLKQNPDLLRQQGLDPSALESVEQSQPTSGQTTKQPTSSTSQNESPSNDTLKTLLKNQVEMMIKPYLKYLAPILSVLFFVTLQSLFAFIAILLPLLTGGVFWILQKSNFVHFETETREVKKLVV